MVKRKAVLTAIAGALALALLPLAAHAGGLPGVAVRIVNPADQSVVASTTTDAEGRFMFENVAAGAFRLEASREDLVAQPPVISHFAAILFAVPVEKAPARVTGRVCSDARLDVSLEVKARVSSMAFDILPGYPKMPLKWNLNGRHSRGLIVVHVKGTGLEQVTEVSLTSALGTLKAYRLAKGPLGQHLLAFFGKKEALAALVPADAKPGDAVPMKINVTTATGTESFDRVVTLVGARKHWKHK